MADRRSPIPHNNKNACLCRDGSYRKDCCGESYFSQGIGNVTRSYFFLYTEEGEIFNQENGHKLFQ